MTLVGMVLGMALIRLAAGRPALTWAAFWTLTAVHVWANVRAMRCLRIAGINQPRLGLLLRHYLRQVGGHAGQRRVPVALLTVRSSLAGAMPKLGGHRSMLAADECALCSFAVEPTPHSGSTQSPPTPPIPSLIPLLAASLVLSGRRSHARTAGRAGEPGAAAAAAPAAPAGAGRPYGRRAVPGGSGPTPGQPGELAAAGAACDLGLAGSWFVCRVAWPAGELAGTTDWPVIELACMHATLCIQLLCS